LSTIDDCFNQEIRRGGPSDLPGIREIQSSSPEAAQWDAVQYLEYELFVSAAGDRVNGFLVGRTVATDEREILNLAVAPKCRRKGIGRGLIKAYLAAFSGTVYLEVRACNEGARRFYKWLGFEEVTVRPEYYQDPPDAAIVLTFHSC
jgi:ribosomal protein S18 acetylase RimI-like enzyme